MKRRRKIRIPRRGRNWLGENSIDGLTDEVFAAGALHKCRNYHIEGQGSLLKRQGHKQYNANQVNGANAINGLVQYEFGTTRHLIALSNGAIKRLDGSSWTAITGSVSPSTSVDATAKSCLFHDGTNGNIVVTDGATTPWVWTGSSNATALTGLTAASDLAVFKNHIFAIKTNDRETTTRYSELGSATSWPAGNLIDCTRDSEGVALSLHNSEVLLVFHQSSIHRIQYDYNAGGALASFFTNQLVDGAVGCIARNSVVAYKGATYFVSDDGFYMVGDPRQPAKYISRSLEKIWQEILPSRRAKIYGFSRGEPWNEIVWLCTERGHTTNNIALVYNPVIAGAVGEEYAWSIFTSPGDALKFNTGCNWIDGDEEQRTVVGTYDGYVHEAWGTTNVSSGYQDGSANVDSTVQTGFLDFGYEGMKGLREMWVDLDLKDSNTFNIAVDGIDSSEELQVVSSVSIGQEATTLDSNFYLDANALIPEGPSSTAFKAVGNSRYFRARLYENGTGIPHRINAMHFLFVPKGMRID